VSALRIQLQVGRQTARSDSASVSIERLLNGYLEQTPQGKEPSPVYGIPGLTEFADLGSQPIRGMIEMALTLYAVSGAKVFRINGSGSPTELGVIGGTGLVDMATDGTNIVIVVPETGAIYVYDSTLGTVTQVADPDALPADSVAWIDGYFIFHQKDSDIFFISALADPTDYDPLDFASAEYRPDRLVRPLVSKREVLMMGASTIEAWRNTGGELFPFTRLEGFFIDVGLAGIFAAVVSNDAVFWLANDKTIRRLDGITATPIQTPAIARIIESWTDISLTVAHAHVWGDHLFICFVNPDGCVVYDQRTQLWHERRSWGLDTWRARTHVICYGKLLFGDSSTAKIYVMDDSLTEAGEIIDFDMTWPYIYTENRKFTVDQVTVVMDTGSAPVYENVPKAVLFTSRDGREWSAGRERELGARGDYNRQVTWTRLGQHYQLACRLRITDPCRRVILSAYGRGEVDDA